MKKINEIWKLLSKHNKIRLVNIDINNSVCHSLVYSMSPDYIISNTNPLELVDDRIICNDVEGTFIQYSTKICGQCSSVSELPILTFNKVDNHSIGNSFIINDSLLERTGLIKISESDFKELDKLSKQISYVDSVLRFK